MIDPLYLLFLSSVACLFVHELDAIQQGEYRFFFSRFGLSDQGAYRCFTALHLPLFVLIFANLTNPTFWVIWDVFMLIHAGLHWGLRHHPLIHFNGWFSRIWIFGGAGLGLLHLIIWLIYQ